MRTKNNMSFIAYQHIERFGTSETEGIEAGEVYVFAKLDGTNGSIWCEDGIVKCGSRNRELSIDNDNHGFCRWVNGQAKFKEYFTKFPNHRLYGEWLIKQKIKDYIETAYREFWVFDVCDENGYIKYFTNENLVYHNIFYIPPFGIFSNPIPNDLISLSKNNCFIKDNCETVGEGIVIKNYNYINKFGRICWAKIVNEDYKILKHKKILPTDLIEERIAKRYVTQDLVDKEYYKIESDGGWNSKLIPRLLQTVYYCIVKEEGWNFVKENKNPIINFKQLQQFVFQEVKSLKPELF